MGNTIQAAYFLTRAVERNTNPYFTKARAVYKDSNPPSPQMLNDLIEESERIQQNNTRLGEKVLLFEGKDKQDHQAIVMAGMIKRLRDAGKFDTCMGPMKGNDTFLVYLFKEAQKKYQSYFTGNGWNEILYTITETDDKLLEKLNEDFFKECSTFKKGYDDFAKTGKQKTGGTRKLRSSRKYRRTRRSKI